MQVMVHPYIYMHTVLNIDSIIVKYVTHFYQYVHNHFVLGCRWDV